MQSLFLELLSNAYLSVVLQSLKRCKLHNRQLSSVLQYAWHFTAARGRFGPETIGSIGGWSPKSFQFEDALDPQLCAFSGTESVEKRPPLDCSTCCGLDGASIWM
jgi:hypothetical protein